MQISSKSGPSAPIEPSQPSSSAQDARARAIARLQGSPVQSQEHPVANPNSISAEEMSAIASPAVPKQDPEPTEEVGQKDTTEAPSEEAKPKEEPLSSQFAILARKEKALRAKVQEFQSAKTAFESQKSELEASKTQLQAQVEKSYKERLARDPMSVLSELGFTPEQLTNLFLNPTKVDPAVQTIMERMEAKIKSLEDAQENSKKSQADQQTTAYKQAVAAIKTETKQLVFTDPEFEMIKTTNSVDDVVQLIEETFKEDGVLMSVEDACREVENHLTEEALKISQAQKIRKRLQQATPAPKPTEAPKQQPQQMKTLTNQISSTRKLSARERAIQAFEENRQKKA